MTTDKSLPSSGVMIDDTVARLEELIMRGELQPGDRLPEQQLADTLGVSRGPLREAIRTLEGRRLLERTPHAGVRVVQLSLDDLEQIFLTIGTRSRRAVKGAWDPKGENPGRSLLGDKGADAVHVSPSSIPDDTKKRLVFDKLIINLDSYELIVDGKKVDTPPKELELLYHLASTPNRVYTRNQLLDEVWGFDYFGDSRTVDVHIKRLREKVENVSDQWALKTVWGVGYKFEVK